MKKTISLIAIFTMCLLQMQAQSTNDTPVTGEKKTALVSSIEKAHKQVQTLTADFTQEKHSSMFSEKVMQKGTISYKSPKQLRWEYTSPKSLVILFNNGKSSMKNEKGTTSTNKMLNEMGNMIMGTLNGDFLHESSMFSAKYYKNSASGTITVVLTPIPAKLKGFYKNIVLTLNAKTMLADKVVLNEACGDSTAITFSNKKTNITLSDNLFK